MESCVVQQFGGVIGLGVTGAWTLQAVGGQPTGSATERPRGRDPGPPTGSATDLLGGVCRKRNCT